MYALPPFASKELISERLSLIFPEGTKDRKNITNDVAAATVFAMLYIGAVQETGVFLGPMHVYRMTAEQSSLTEKGDRILYRNNVGRKDFNIAGTRWYADNTRESIRDSALREGFVAIGAVLSNDAIPTTSSKPRYSLKTDFSHLFDPELTGEALELEIKRWQLTNLSKTALDRLSLNKHSAAHGSKHVLINYPNGETRKIEIGPSSEISKHVIENFAPRFLQDPVVLWLSTSGGKMISSDDELAASIGLKIEVDKNLPDIILVDLGPQDPLLVFVEVVASDGAVTERRQQAIYQLTDAAGFDRAQVTFMTAYRDREGAAFKKTVSGLAWNSFVWFVSEPEKIIHLKESPNRLTDYLSRD